jgi:hypothetical protein
MKYAKKTIPQSGEWPLFNKLRQPVSAAEQKRPDT